MDMDDSESAQSMPVPLTSDNLLHYAVI